MKTQENNVVRITGIIPEAPKYEYEAFGENFYTAYIESRRVSGIVDRVPLTIPEMFLGANHNNVVGEQVTLCGSLRSYNHQTPEAGKSRLVLSVFVHEIDYSGDVDMNRIELHGYICKKPVYRKTLFGRKITDLLLAVNRAYGRADYIPCICWGRYAMKAGKYEVGTKLSAIGRIQSRDYVKRFEDGTEVQKTAYEVSIEKVEVLA